MANRSSRCPEKNIASEKMVEEEKLEYFPRIPRTQILGISGIGTPHHDLSFRTVIAIDQSSTCVTEYT